MRAYLYVPQRASTFADFSRKLRAPGCTFRLASTVIDVIKLYAGQQPFALTLWEFFCIVTKLLPEYLCNVLTDLSYRWRFSQLIYAGIVLWKLFVLFIYAFLHLRYRNLYAVVLLVLG